VYILARIAISDKQMFLQLVSAMSSAAQLNESELWEAILNQWWTRVCIVQQISGSLSDGFTLSLTICLNQDIGNWPPWELQALFQRGDMKSLIVCRVKSATCGLMYLEKYEKQPQQLTGKYKVALSNAGSTLTF
jgi:hypothetical protein